MKNKNESQFCEFLRKLKLYSEAKVKFKTLLKPVNTNNSKKKTNWCYRTLRYENSLVFLVFYYRLYF